MLSPTHQNSFLSSTATIYALFLRKIKDWVRREILDEDPYDDAALREGALLAELIQQKQMHQYYPSPCSDQSDQAYQEALSVLRQSLHNPGFL